MNDHRSPDHPITRSTIADHPINDRRSPIARSGDGRPQIADSIADHRSPIADVIPVA
jgi:hypothetical protein